MQDQQTQEDKGMRGGELKQELDSLSHLVAQLQPSTNVVGFSFVLKNT